MAAAIENQVMTPEEKRFREYLLNGDDFIKIEIFRSAVSWYRKALELKPENPEARQKLEDALARIKKENKAIYIIVSIAAVVTLLIIFLR